MSSRKRVFTKNLTETLLAVVVVGAVAVGYFRIVRGTSSPTLQEHTPQSSMASGAASSAPPEARPLPRTRVRVSETLPEDTAVPAPKGNVISFELKEGLAVAYGDQILGQPSPEDIGEMPNPQMRRMYEAPSPMLWDKPIIPYAINPELPRPERVTAAIDHFNQTTAIRFVPWRGEPDAIVFEKGVENCLSYLGRMGGAQPIKLAAGCSTQEVLHEIMHALGFVHEHSRTDRDNYIEVIWPQIQPAFRAQYVVVPETFMEASRTGDFDYASVMMYSPQTFGLTPDQPTLRSRTPNRIEPIREGLSDGDRARLRRLYP